MAVPSLADIEATLHRLFIDAAGASLRKEDRQKCHEIQGLFAHLFPLKKNAHVVDAAAGKSSVGFVAAELSSIARLTVLERSADRVAACREARARVRSGLEVDVRHADVADASAWPEAPDVVVALHACGSAADAVLDGAIRSRARRVLVVPCCYARSLSFHEKASAVVATMGFVADDVIRRRLATSIVDMERKLRLEAAGYEADIEEFVAPTVTPHNVAFVARHTGSAVRIERARARLAALHAAAGAPLTPQ